MGRVLLLVSNTKIREGLWNDFDLGVVSDTKKNDYFAKPKFYSINLQGNAGF